MAGEAGEMGRHPAAVPGARFPGGPAWGPNPHSKTSARLSPSTCGPQSPLRGEDGDSHDYTLTGDAHEEQFRKEKENILNNIINCKKIRSLLQEKKSYFFCPEKY